MTQGVASQLLLPIVVVDVTEAVEIVAVRLSLATSGMPRSLANLPGHVQLSNRRVSMPCCVSHLLDEGL
eukprot:5408405-Pyramimonas_sp.AAC.1